MDEKDDRVVGVLAPHINPLVDAADVQLEGLLQSARRDDAVEVGDDGARFITRSG